MNRAALIGLERFCPWGPDSGVCAICMDELSPGRVGVKLACGHRFHESCCLRWFGAKTTCPLCRRDQNTSRRPRPRRQLFVTCPALGMREARVAFSTPTEALRWCNGASVFRLSRAAFNEDGVLEIW